MLYTLNLYSVYMYVCAQSYPTLCDPGKPSLYIARCFYFAAFNILYSKNLTF